MKNRLKLIVLFAASFLLAGQLNTTPSAVASDQNGIWDLAHIPIQSAFDNGLSGSNLTIVDGTTDDYCNQHTFAYETPGGTDFNARIMVCTAVNHANPYYWQPLLAWEVYYPSDIPYPFNVNDEIIANAIVQWAAQGSGYQNDSPQYNCSPLHVYSTGIVYMCQGSTRGGTGWIGEWVQSRAQNYYGKDFSQDPDFVLWSGNFNSPTVQLCAAGKHYSFGYGTCR